MQRLKVKSFITTEQKEWLKSLFSLRAGVGNFGTSGAPLSPFDLFCSFLVSQLNLL